MEITNIESDEMQHRLVKQNPEYVDVPSNEIKTRLEKNGIESFVPDAEVTFLMSMKGYYVTKEFYDGKGNLQKTEMTYIPPNCQAAITFLKIFCPEKYGQMGNRHNNIFVGNKIISQQLFAADLERLKRLAGNLIEPKADESHEDPSNPLTP